MIDQIKQALEKSTPGKWEVTNLGDVSITTGYRFEDGRHIATWIADMCEDDRDEEEIHADAHLIANATEWLRYLVGEVERLEKEFDELWDQAQTWREESGN